MNKPLKITIIILSVLLAIFAIIAIAVSPVAKSYVNHHGEDLIGRRIEVGTLRVNICTGGVKLYNLSVYEEDGNTHFLKLDTLDVSLKLRRLLAHEIHVRHVTLANLDVNILQNGSQFNFTSILDHFQSTEEETEDTAASPWTFAFYDIRLSHWKVYYADQQRQSDWHLNDLNIKVPGVYFNGEQNTDAGITLALAEGGTLGTNIHYNMESNDFSIGLKLNNFAISNLKAYLTDMLRIGNLQGLFDADLHAKGNLSTPLKSKLSGFVALRDADIRDTKQTPVLQCSRLAVNVNNIVLADNLFDIQAVTLDGITSRFDLYRNHTNFSSLIIPQAVNTSTDTMTTPADTTTPKPMELIVRHLSLRDAAFTYADHTLADPFEFPVTHIHAEADNLTLSGHNALRLFAALPHGGHAVIDWNGTLNDVKKQQSLRLNIKNVKLTDLNPYIVTYLGQPFTDGTFSFTSLNTIRHSQLNGTNTIDIYKAEAGKRRKDIDSALHVPLKAALYILKDKDDKIILDVPISGNIDHPEFNYMKLVWKTLRNLFVKVATAPARHFAQTLGLKGDLDFIPFENGQQGFTSEQYYTFDQLVKISQYNSNTIIALEQHLAADTTAAAKEQAQQRNNAIFHYLTTQGMPASSLQLTTSPTPQLPTGYAITSFLKD